VTRRTCLGLIGWAAIERSGPTALARPRPEADFEALFDGRSLAGWTAIGGEPGAWRAEAGVLSARRGKSWISTNRAYGDFDLRLQYRVERGGNSGVLLRAPHRGDPSFEGVEIQILDDDAPFYRNLKPEQYTGSVYGVIAARRGFARPPGSWNTLGIKLEGAKIQVDLNGTRVVDARLDEHGWALKRHPGLARPRGFLGLQAHDTPVWFRDIAIKAT